MKRVLTGTNVTGQSLARTVRVNCLCFLFAFPSLCWVFSLQKTKLIINFCLDDFRLSLQKEDSRSCRDFKINFCCQCGVITLLRKAFDFYFNDTCLIISEVKKNQS